VRSSVRDMLRFIDATLSPPDGALGEALRMTTKLQATLANPATKGKQKMGLGWHIASPDTMLWKDGATYGCQSYVAIDMAKNRGVVMLTDSGDLDGLAPLEGELYDLLADL
jgi:CubicO group peptidase (beta-lactamase class C family)